MAFWTINLDGSVFASSDSDAVGILAASVDLEANTAGTFTFTVPSGHPFLSELHRRTSVVSVDYNGETIFSGFPVETTEDFQKNLTVRCEGDLSYLNDSILRPHHYQGVTVRQLLSAYITAHNNQTEARKHFTLGTVTVTDPNNSITCFTNYNSTMEEIGSDLIDDLGGFLRVRYSGSTKYLDYLAASPNTNSQVIQLGHNLINLSRDINTEEICTVLIPLGARLESEESEVEGLEERLTIESVNDGLDYLESTAINEFGRIAKTAVWDDVTTPAALKRKGEQYLSQEQFASMVITATAFDLSLSSEQFESFKLLDTIRVVSPIHGLDASFMLTQQSIDLLDPANCTITLGMEKRENKLSALASRIDLDLTQVTDRAVADAVANATSLITSAMGGYVYKTRSELYIMDTNDPATATKVWRWNINGLGYSSTGISGPYGLAMTMDGRIVADYISTGTLDASNLTVRHVPATGVDVSGGGNVQTALNVNANAISAEVTRATTSEQSDNLIASPGNRTLHNSVASFALKAVSREDIMGNYCTVSFEAKSDEACDIDCYLLDADQHYITGTVRPIRMRQTSEYHPLSVSLQYPNSDTEPCYMYVRSNANVNGGGGSATATVNIRSESLVIDGSATDAYSRIEQTAEGIVANVTSIQSVIDENSGAVLYKEQLSTVFQQTDEYARIEQTEKKIGDHAEEQSAYIQYGRGTLTLGQSQNQASAELTSTSLTFNNSRGIPKVIVAEDTTIPNLNCETLQMGHFRWIQRSNGHYSLKKV